MMESLTLILPSQTVAPAMERTSTLDRIFGRCPWIPAQGFVSSPGEVVKD
ncbi:MAG: hypothetical protein ACRC67_26985 [Inquilinus sp.]